MIKHKTIAVCDIGGTRIKSALWDGKELLNVEETDTEAHLGGRHVLENVLKILSSKGSFDAIGISTAGQVDPSTGIIVYANDNIPGYTGVNVAKELGNYFHVPVAVENDVNAAALGELHFGAGVGADSFLCLTYGTGVGGALIINGKLCHGSNFSAGHFGGIITHPDDIRKNIPYSGCYESYASTTALVSKISSYDKQLTNGRIIFERLGDPEVISFVDAWVDEIVLGLVSLIHALDPDRVILGGGIMAQQYVISEVSERCKELLLPSFKNIPILPARLGNQAGLMGAAYLAEELYGK